MKYSKIKTLLLMTALSLTACGGGSSDSPAPVDTDNDGIEDTLDAFPNDASETQDSDGDGVGDNADVFPSDSSETLDTDNDGVGDNADAFPENDMETMDSDLDGVGDNSDVFPDDATETVDSDEDGVGDNADAFPSDASRSETACGAEGTDVNFEALLTEDCSLLSEYNLFADPTNPTTGVNGTKSLKYDLSMALFTDYATKYRFVVMPDDGVATYAENEVMELPVGSVLIKTFSLPPDTSMRGFANEKIIETRLLIHRESGWVALPYKWNAESTDAFFVDFGPNFTETVTHKGEAKEFKYVIPSTEECKECHQLLDSDESGNAIAGSGKFAPIGPKARFLNYAIDYEDGTENQLTKWVANNMLTGVPDDLDTIVSLSYFSDDDIADVSANDYSVEEINDITRGYLDINCAHCHRKTGSANNYGLFLEFQNETSTNTGICKSPIAPPGNSSLEGDLIVIKPGDADGSFMYERVTSLDGGLKMPKIGRSLIHTEGAELIKTWINVLDEEPLNHTACD